MAWKDWKDYQDGRSKESIEKVIKLKSKIKLNSIQETFKVASLKRHLSFSLKILIS